MDTLYVLDNLDVIETMLSKLFCYQSCGNRGWFSSFSSFPCFLKVLCYDIYALCTTVLWKYEIKCRYSLFVIRYAWVCHQGRWLGKWSIDHFPNQRPWWQTRADQCISRVRKKYFSSVDIVSTSLQNLVDQTEIWWTRNRNQ